MAENLSLQNFDWDAYENESKGTQNEELLKKYDETLSAIKDQEVVEGTVMSINKREVVVNPSLPFCPTLAHQAAAHSPFSN